MLPFEVEPALVKQSENQALALASVNHRRPSFFNSATLKPRKCCPFAKRLSSWATTAARRFSSSVNALGGFAV
jgi:hypothetical protein